MCLCLSMRACIRYFDINRIAADSGELTRESCEDEASESQEGSEASVGKHCICVVLS